MICLTGDLHHASLKTGNQQHAAQYAVHRHGTSFFGRLGQTFFLLHGLIADPFGHAR